MTKKRALDFVLSQPWAITQEYLELIAAIAEREHEYAGNLDALAAKLGRPLGNTMTASIRDGIAIIPVEGPLFKRAGFFDAISGATEYTTIAQDLQAALDNPDVQAIMLVIDSPGGQVAGLSDLVAMITAAGKPVHVHTDSQMASAALWLGAAGSRVSASENAVIGSVGAVMGFTVRAPREGEKSYKFVSSMSPLKQADPATEEGAQVYQTMVDDMGQNFVNGLAKSRGMKPDAVVEKFGRGAMMIAAKAKIAGMIDEVSTFEQAFAYLKQEISSMDFKSLTAQALAENRPDLVTAIQTEALAKVEKVDAQAVRAEAVKAERERISAITALNMPGAEAIVSAAIADGSDVGAASLKIVQHMQATNAGKGAAALSNIQKAEATMVPPKAVEPAGTDPQAEAAEKLQASMADLRKAGVIR